MTRRTSRLLARSIRRKTAPLRSEIDAIKSTTKAAERIGRWFGAVALLVDLLELIAAYDEARETGEWTDAALAGTRTVRFVSDFSSFVLNSEKVAELATKYAPKTARGAGRALPIIGYLLSAALAFQESYEKREQLESLDVSNPAITATDVERLEDEADRQFVEGVGWSTIAAGAIASETGVGAPVGSVLIVAGACMVGYSYASDVYASWTAPNDYERLAEALCYEMV